MLTVEKRKEKKIKQKRAFTPLLHRYLHRNFGYVLIAPAVIFLVAFALYPFAYTFRLSVSRFIPREASMTFVGLNNFAELFQDPDFLTTIKNTFVFSLGTLAVSLGLGLLLALLLNSYCLSNTFKNISRGLLILPWLYSSAAAAVTWSLLFHPQGLLNYFFLTLGIAEKPVLFLADAKWAMLSVIMILSWKAYPFLMVMILSSLQSVPNELYDAAAVDGATGLDVFFRITLPLIRPVILTVSMLMFIWAFGHFDLIKIVTRGGPGLTTQTFPYYVYRAAFFKLGFDIGSAASIIMFLMLLSLSIVYAWFYTKGGLAYGKNK